MSSTRYREMVRGLGPWRAIPLPTWEAFLLAVEGDRAVLAWDDAKASLTVALAYGNRPPLPPGQGLAL